MWGEDTTGTCHPCTRTVGRTVPSRPAIHRSFCLLYIPSATYTGNFWCLWFGANLYAEKCKMAIINFENFSRPVNILQWAATLKFVTIRPDLCAKNIYSASPPCFVLFLSKNKWSSTIYNIWDWQNSDLHSACSLPPAKINIQTKIIFKSTLVHIDINMLSGKLFDF